MIEGYNNLCKFGFDPSVSYVITDSNVEKFESFVHLLLTEKMDNLIIQFEKPSLSLTSNSKTMNIKKWGHLQHIFILLWKKLESTILLRHHFHYA